MSVYGFDNSELLRVARDTADQKGLGIDVIIKAIESALEAAGRKKYGNCKIKVNIDRKTGNISVFRELLVIDENSDNIQQVKHNSSENESDDSGDFKLLTLSDALLINPDAKEGDILLEELPVIELDYNSAKIAKQKIAQVIRMAERNKQYEEYKNRVGDLVYGIVKRVEYGNVIVDLNGNESFLHGSKLIKGEIFRQGDKIKAHIEDVKKSTSGPQIFLSRVNKGFMEELFKQEIPEVYDGIVVIKAIARDPGSKAKVAVFSSDKNIDPVGACIGARGSRINNIISELHGEKIDVVLYSSDLGEFVVNAISPVEILKVIIDEDKERVEVIVPDEQISTAIGRKGQNIRLASELVGWKIDVLGENMESTRKIEELKEFNMQVKALTDALNVDDIIAQLLVAENFNNIEDIHNSTISDLMAIEGFTEDIVIELKNRASQYLSDKKDELDNQIHQMGVDKAMLNLPFLQSCDIITLFENGVKTIEDVAELSTEEFIEKFPNINLSSDKVGNVIMEARKEMGWL